MASMVCDVLVIGHDLPALVVMAAAGEELPHALGQQFARRQLRQEAGIEHAVEDMRPRRNDIG